MDGGPAEVLSSNLPDYTANAFFTLTGAKGTGLQAAYSGGRPVVTTSRP